MAQKRMDNSFRNHGSKQAVKKAQPQGMSDLTWGRVHLRLLTIQYPKMPMEDLAVRTGMSPEDIELWLSQGRKIVSSGN